MKYTIPEAQGTINLEPATQVDEILRNISILLATPQGSVPLDRAFGLSQRAVDRPVDIAKTLLVGDITGAIERFEPRAKVANISFRMEDTRLIPVVEVTIDDEYK